VLLCFHGMVLLSSLSVSLLTSLSGNHRFVGHNMYIGSLKMSSSTRDWSKMVFFSAF